MKMMDRRSFLKTSMATAAGLSAVPAWAQEQKPAAPANLNVTGANGDIRVAVVGFNGRGGNHISAYQKMPGVRLVALCDVDQKVLDKGAASLKKNGIEVQTYRDIRKLLENKDIDAISIATPNHWHALATIWSVQAGKDVYCEKPLSHNVWEGRKVVEAARKYGRMVQTGSQCRSSRGLQEGIAWVQEGNIGKILRARGLCYKRRASIGKVDGDQAVPDTIDYELWSGPAPLVKPHRNSEKNGPIHYEWHWIWNYGNGDLGNQGVHQMDIARWVLGEKELAPLAFSIGGRLGYEDDGETPNTQIIFQEYKKAPLIFEVRGLPAKTGVEKMDNYHGASIGVVADCENGRLVIPSYEEAIAYDKDDKEIKRWKAGGDHFGNFIKAIRSRKHTDLVADAEEGHISAALCHTANISYRLGKKESSDKIRDAIKNDKDATEALGRMEEHLAANDVDCKKTPVTLGAVLKMDVKAERVIDNSAANKMLTREYRKPFVVPEKV
jgi:predicted dehydrogenase